MKALVVDDSKMMRMTVRKLLESLDVEVIEAEDGQKALDALGENKDGVVLIMLDWNMPVMNGIDCLKGVRSNPNCNDIKVVMLTTENQMDAIRTAITEGANEYVMKPFTEEMLLEKVKMVVPGAGG